MLRPLFSLLICISVSSCGGGGGGSSASSPVGGGGSSGGGGVAPADPPDHFGMFSYFEESSVDPSSTRNATAYALSSSRLWYVNKDFISTSSINQTWAFTTASYEPDTVSAAVSEIRRYRAFNGLSSLDDSVNFRHLFFFDEDFGDEAITLTVTKDTIDIPFRLTPTNPDFGVRTHNRVNENTAALSKISGAYVSYTVSDYSGSVDYSINISETGEISGNDTQGCSYEGSTNVENDGLHLYPVNLVVSNCDLSSYTLYGPDSANFDGDYNGVLTHIEENGSDTLTIAINSETKAMHFEITR